MNRNIPVVIFIMFLFTVGLYSNCSSNNVGISKNASETRSGGGNGEGYGGKPFYELDPDFRCGTLSPWLDIPMVKSQINISTTGEITLVDVCTGQQTPVAQNSFTLLGYSERFGALQGHLYQYFATLSDIPTPAGYIPIKAICDSSPSPFVDGLRGQVIGQMNLVLRATRSAFPIYSGDWTLDSYGSLPLNQSTYLSAHSEMRRPIDTSIPGTYTSPGLKVAASGPNNYSFEYFTYNFVSSTGNCFFPVTTILAPTATPGPTPTPTPGPTATPGPTPTPTPGPTATPTPTPTPGPTATPTPTPSPSPTPMPLTFSATGSRSRLQMVSPTGLTPDSFEDALVYIGASGGSGSPLVTRIDVTSDSGGSWSTQNPSLAKPWFMQIISSNTGSSILLPNGSIDPGYMVGRTLGPSESFAIYLSDTPTAKYTTKLDSTSSSQTPLGVTYTITIYYWGGPTATVSATIE